MDDTWRAVFITRDDDELAECAIVAWDSRELECTTALSPEQLVHRKETVRLRLIPPPELVADIAHRRSNWTPPPARVPTCCVNPPGPGTRYTPPVFVRARVVQAQVVSNVVHLTLNAGRDHGISATWFAAIVDEADRPLAGGNCAIVRVDAKVTVCSTALADAPIHASGRVRLSPP
jgi:hypothetical protein